MRKRILVVTDNQDFLMNTAILLSRMGFKVIPAESGAEVRNLIKLSGPDVVMLDMQSPRLDAVTILKLLKEDKQLSDIPVIMLSDDSSSGTVRRCKSLGCDVCLLKPVNISKLHGIIQKFTFSQIGKNRKHLRVSFIRKVIVTYKRVLYELYAETLSEGGIYVRGLKPFPIGSEVAVTVPLKKGKSIRLKGRVIYTKGLFGGVFKIPPGMAIEFKGVTQKNAKVLRDYVEDLIAEDILDSQREAFLA
jgi:CheY-like chemotaxis protein